ADNDVSAISTDATKLTFPVRNFIRKSPSLFYVINAAQPVADGSTPRRALRSMSVILAVDSDIDGFSQPLDDGVDRAAVDNERRSQQHVVAADAIGRSSHRINHQSARHRFTLDPRI